MTPAPPPPSGLQLDLLILLIRLEQVAQELDDGNPGLAMHLLTQRVLIHDLPRLAGYLTPETLWWAGGSMSGPDGDVAMRLRVRAGAGER